MILNPMTTSFAKQSILEGTNVWFEVGAPLRWNGKNVVESGRLKLVRRAANFGGGTHRLSGTKISSAIVPGCLETNVSGMTTGTEKQSGWPKGNRKLNRKAEDPSP